MTDLVPVDPPSKFTVAAAEELTQQICDNAEGLWMLIGEAYYGRVWEVLGYPTFKAYIVARFPFTARHAYRLLDQRNVIATLAVAAGVTTRSLGAVVNEPTARKVKASLPAVAAAVAAAVEPTASPAARLQAVVDVVDVEVVDEPRSPKPARAGESPRERQRRRFIAACEAIVELGDATTLGATLRPGPPDADRTAVAHARDDAYAWLLRFKTANGGFK